MLFSVLILVLLKMLHCFLFGHSFVGFVKGLIPPLVLTCVFLFFRILAAVAKSSVLRMCAGICCSCVCSRFGLVCLFGSGEI